MRLVAPVSPRKYLAIAGYTCANDISVRDWQGRAQTMTIGKSFDTHRPLGPWLVTPNELGDPNDLAIRCFVDGELRQDARTARLSSTASRPQAGP